ncbi:hypothetical protein EVAR_86565_1 [Eumeta japonica]|uniref:Uncharacterized protein n=1 Tax=Eumeta variegata TaxID=151549 RepID=A0A4C2A7R7_EUMVA|nr:hypothetical protein EVAR_86565_1 [Eumeta japonica]
MMRFILYKSDRRRNRADEPAPAPPAPAPPAAYNPLFIIQEARGKAAVTAPITHLPPDVALCATSGVAFCCYVLGVPSLRRVAFGGGYCGFGSD